MTDPVSPPPPAPSPPNWSAPRQRGPSVAAVVVGVVFLGIGVWYFLDDTLGLTMPSISWDTLWPVALIALGGVILFRAAADRRR